jgi:hypothetical protein
VVAPPVPPPPVAPVLVEVVAPPVPVEVVAPPALLELSEVLLEPPVFDDEPQPIATPSTRPSHPILRSGFKVTLQVGER